MGPPMDAPRLQQERDEDMNSERDSSVPVPEPTEEHWPKRLKTSRESYTVSNPGQSLRDESPLRKAPTQCAWDRDRILPPTPPPEYEEWVAMHASTRPFNPAFDKARYLSTPVYRHANPHFRLTNERADVETPMPGHDSFTPGPLPHIHISDWRHVGNVKDEQREMVERRCDTMLALVPHGGGRLMNTEGEMLAKMYGEYLSSFRFEGYGGDGIGVKVFPPDPKKAGGPGSQNPFAQPWSFLVDVSEDFCDILQRFLINQEHFGVDPARSFSIHPLQTTEPESWKLVTLISSYIDPPGSSHNDVLMQRAAVMETVKGRLGRDPTFRDLVGKLAANNIGHTGSREQMLATVLSSYHLELATIDTKEGPKKAFVLLGRPITSGREELARMRETIVNATCGTSGDHFYVGAHKVRVVDESKPGAPTIDCKLCKSDMHRTVDCPLPNARGWKGITPTDLFKQQDEGTSSKASRALDDPRAIMNSLMGRMRGEEPFKPAARGGKQRGGKSRGSSGSGHGQGGRSHGGRGGRRG
ncbi:hypothetical protein C8Q80DRAFT_1295507 [Daedaleopsis nitida]|nr:hypothetical protein C8Q80DRAFT_1295507 [Daedaleopsis nitida]